MVHGTVLGAAGKPEILKNLLTNWCQQQLQAIAIGEANCSRLAFYTKFLPVLHKPIGTNLLCHCPQWQLAAMVKDNIS